jgi:hypothetical protein
LAIYFLQVDVGVAMLLRSAAHRPLATLNVAATQPRTIEVDRVDLFLSPVESLVNVEYS